MFSSIESPIPRSVKAGAGRQRERVPGRRSQVRKALYYPLSQVAARRAGGGNCGRLAGQRQGFFSSSRQPRTWTHLQSTTTTTNIRGGPLGLGQERFESTTTRFHAPAGLCQRLHHQRRSRRGAASRSSPALSRGCRTSLGVAPGSGDPAWPAPASVHWRTPTCGGRWGRCSCCAATC